MQKPRNYRVLFNYRAGAVSEDHKALLRSVFHLNDTDIQDRSDEAELLEQTEVYHGTYDVAETKAMQANDFVRDHNLQQDTIFTIQAMG